MSCLEEDNAAGIIRGRMSKLIQSTSSTDSVLTFLYEKKVINLSTLEKIQAERTDDDKNREMYLCIQRKEGFEALEHLLQALKLSENVRPYEWLSEDYEKLKATHLAVSSPSGSKNQVSMNPQLKVLNAEVKSTASDKPSVSTAQKNGTQTMNVTNVVPKKFQCTGLKPDEIKLRLDKLLNLQHLFLLDVSIESKPDEQRIRNILTNMKSLRKIECSIRIRKETDKQVVLYLSELESASTLVTLRLENMDLKYSAKKIPESENAKFPFVKCCEFKRCKIDKPLLSKFPKQFPGISAKIYSTSFQDCVDEKGKKLLCH